MLISRSLRLIVSRSLRLIGWPLSSVMLLAELEKTLEYARMVERSGCSVLAVHGRTREQKDLTATRADWDAIKAVKEVSLCHSEPIHIQDKIHDRSMIGP